jgi:hypothetical protein
MAKMVIPDTTPKPLEIPLTRNTRNFDTFFTEHIPNLRGNTRCR